MVEQKAKLQQQEATPKREEKTRMAAPKCATEKKFRHVCRTKTIEVCNEQQAVEDQTVEVPTFRQRLHQVREMKDSMRKRLSL